MAKTIRQLRQERDWSQLAVAVRIGASVNAVYKWERGLVVPQRKYQQRLATIFGVPVEAIAFGPPAQAPQDRP